MEKIGETGRIGALSPDAIAPQGWRISKTWRNFVAPALARQRRGVRLPSAAFFRERSPGVLLVAVPRCVLPGGCPRFYVAESPDMVFYFRQVFSGRLAPL